MAPESRSASRASGTVASIVRCPCGHQWKTKRTLSVWSRWTCRKCGMLGEVASYVRPRIIVWHPFTANDKLTDSRPR